MSISLDDFLSKIRAGSPVADFPLGECAVLAKTSIHAAAALGDPDGVRHHLDRDSALVNLAKEGWTPLAYLCGEPFFQLSARHLTSAGQCAAILLDRGADPMATITQEAPDVASGTPTFALEQIRKNLGVAVTFAERGIGRRDITDEDRAQIGFALLGMSKLSPLRTAVMQLEAGPRAKQQLERIRASARADFDKPLPASFEDRISVMQTHSQNRALARWKLVLDRGLDPNLASMDNGGTHLHYLAAHRMVAGPAVVRLFLKYGADPNALTREGKTPLSYAVRTGNAEIADVLMEFGAQTVTVSMSDRFMGACARADIAVAREIASSLPDVFAHAHDECAELLVDSSHFRECYGVAVPDRIRLLGDLGFDFGRMGKKGCTGFHVAAWHGQVENVHAYLEFAPVNLRDSIYGTSPLGWIAHGSGSERLRDVDNDRAVVKSLLKHGAKSQFAVNSWGIGPRDIASHSVAALFPS